MKTGMKAAKKKSKKGKKSMKIVLKEFKSLATGVVDLGTPFPVQYRIVRFPAGGGGALTDRIAVSCKSPYSASPDITVSLEAGEDEKVGSAQITVNGPAGAATVVVDGDLIETHSFPQGVK